MQDGRMPARPPADMPPPVRQEHAGMRSYALAYVATAVALVLADSVWLTTMIPIYREGLGDLLAPRPAFAPAIVFYAMFPVGIVVFAVSAGWAAGRWRSALVRGALFGLLAYATYDLSNQATLHGWPLRITLLDMAWGTVLSALAASAGYFATARLERRRRGGWGGDGGG
jgi:uncharacterized membrane protein